MTVSSEIEYARRPSWARRRMIAPLALQLTQGLTPKRLALALAVGGVIAVNPFLGSTTVGCLAAGALLQLNHPALQVANLVGAPFQLALVVPWIRAGEWLYQADPISISPTQIVAEFSAGPWQFLRHFGLTGLHAASAWLIAAPFLGVALYLVLHPALRVLSRKLTRPAPTR